MLGHKLCHVLNDDFDVFATFRSQVPALPQIYGSTRPIAGVDVYDFDSVVRAVRDVRPDFVLNGIGIVKQRVQADDPIISISINSLFPHRLAQVCRESASRLVHFSTDCVFSGSKGNYSESDNPDPVDLYGRSKLLGEVGSSGVLTIRTSIIGREIEHRSGLLEWFLSRSGSRISGYARTIYSGVTTNLLADIIRKVIVRNLPLDGIVHLSGPSISKFDLLVALDRAFGTKTRIDRDETHICDRSLDSDAFWSRIGDKQPQWKEMIAGLVDERHLYESL